MRLFRQILLTFVLATVIGALTYTAVSRYVVHKAEENLRSIMLSHRSFHHYIQRVMHPTYYKARDEGKIAADFYAPEILSSSFVARVMHGFFNEERAKEGLPVVYYKLAANNPRNPVNKADEKEAAMIRLFNENRELKEFREVTTVNGQKQLVYAKPFLETNQACIRCHGRRNDAPAGLQQAYPGEGGFNESTGVIRAIESIRIPLDDDLLAVFVATAFSLSSVLILSALYLFNLRLRLKVQQSTEALQNEVQERKSVQDALAVSEENYRQFASLTSDYVHKCSRKVGAPYRIQWIGGALSTILGYSTEEMFELGCWVSIIHPDDKAAVADALGRLQPGDVKEFTFRIVAKDHGIRWVSDRCRCVKGQSDEELILYGAASDVTDRRKIEGILEFTRVTVNAVSDAIYWVAPDGRIVDVNDAACRSLGYSRDEFQQLEVADIDPGSTRDVMKQQFNELRRQGSIRLESTHRAKNGRVFPVEIVANYVRYEDEERNCGVVRDISERKILEGEIRASNQFNRQIINCAHEGIVVYGTDLRYKVWNPFMEEMSGVKASEVIGRHPLEVFPFLKDTGVMERLEKALAGENPEEVEFPFSSSVRNGWNIDSSVPLRSETGEIIGVISTVQDITDRKNSEEERLNLEKQLLHTQKLESLGVLAGGIAHDFNNILMAIIGNADLALMRINKESPVVENLHRIEQSAARAADLAKQMLAYSGKGRFVIEQINLNNLMEDMLHMLEVSISKKAVLRLNPYQNLPMVEADATQIRQIIMNLVINSSEAIGDRSGVISITTGCIDCDRSYLKDVWLDENISEGLYVYLEIADTGCGMDKEVMSKLFDPFFTTKFTGRGLGMAAVLGIVRGHKGAIKVYSEQNKGSSFKILLPASNRPPEIFNGQSNHDAWAGSGTVLLVDDEETVRGIGREMLQELGFTVITACDGRDAVEIFKTEPGIGFVILDLTMPHMDGEQCFRELRQIKSDIKVIMSSGYNEQEVTQKFAGKGLAGFIQKPYRLSVLKEAIRGI